MTWDAWLTIARLHYTYRICPTNRLIIERKADPIGARWCFWRICDSPNDVKRHLAMLRGEPEIATQMELVEDDNT